MKLNLIIPTYNRAKSLAETLQSVEDATVVPNFDVEVTAVNNSSGVESEGVIKDLHRRFRQKKFNYLFESGHGCSVVDNAGIRDTDGDLIAIIDDDHQVEKIFWTPRYFCKDSITGVFKEVFSKVKSDKTESLRERKGISIFLGFSFFGNILESKFNRPLEKLA